jgi:hypothetical protein
MPTPNTKGALRVTASDYEHPFTTPVVRPGIGGLNLRSSIDQIDPAEASRLTNMTWDRNGQLTSRPGLNRFATSGGSRIHTIARLNNPLTEGATRVWGIDSAIYVGLTGALSSVDSGYSGSPVSMVTYRPTLSAEPWVYIANKNRMRKIRSDGLVTEIGLPAPSAQPTVALATENTTNAALCDSADSSQAANWTTHIGTALSAPTLTDETDIGHPLHPNSQHIYFVTFGGAASYYSFAALPRALNLGTVGSSTGTPTASVDEDHIHVTVKFSNPNDITEFRLYFICSDDFDAADPNLPGTAPNVNSNSYVKSFRPGDLGKFYQGDESATDASSTTAGTSADSDFLTERETGLTKEDIQDIINERFVDDDGTYVPYNPTPIGAAQQTEQGKRVQASVGPSGSHEWTQFGIGGAPLRKSEFRRIGSTAGRDWSTVTGIVIAVIGPANGVAVGLSDIWLTGGAGPDNSDVGAAGYDYRYTDFDTRTGAESNPCPILPDADPYGIFSTRRPVTITPAAGGNSAYRQRFYRRGGTLGNDWFYLGQNTSDGAAFSDTLSDAAITLADTLEIDHHQPVQTVDTNGAILKAQPLKAIWGPVQDIIFGCGDKYRPGHLYWSNLGEPDHWSSANTFEVCSPSEELMNGGYYGGQAFVFSRDRMYWIYPNLTGDGTVTVTPTACSKGLHSRWAVTVASQGIFFANRDGIWRTSGGNPELVSQQIGDEDDGGIFQGKTVNGYAPIDWDAESDLRLQVWGTEVWFQYRDTGGTTQHLILDLAASRWKHYNYGFDIGTVFVDAIADDDNTRMIITGRDNGDAFYHEGTNDNGAAISCTYRSGANAFGLAREDKLYGDLFIDMDRDLTDISVVTYLNDETTTNGTQTINSGSGRERYPLDAFGTTPQRGRSVSVQVSWSAGARQPKLEQVGASIIPEPEATNQRATQWDDCGSSNEKWLFGVMIECDTFGVDREVIIEYMQGTTVATAHTETINHSGRRRAFLDWAFVRADRVRIRPTTDCAPWILYECDWIHHDQPPRIGLMDSGEEGPWDTYYTGLDLDINTFGATKTFNVFVDGTALTNPVTGTTTFNVTQNGRGVSHLTFGPGRGHIYRFVSTDNNQGLLYNHRWHLDEEPSEQTNWNQNFSILGTHTDKWIKGVKLECDTFGANKTVTIEVDGSVAATLTVNTPDRRVVHEAFPQVRGRVVRILPTDNNPGRLYSASLIFDEEPLGLDRWETQELNLGSTGWKALLEGWVTLRSSATVTLVVTHVREDGTSTDRTYTLPNTSGVKAPHYLTFEADKAVLFKFLFTSAADFWLYRPESGLKVMDWQGGVREVKPFGDDDLDLKRGLYTAESSASVGGAERQ